jgi:5-methylcytosine-specific restriction endonuclease McrA
MNLVKANDRTTLLLSATYQPFAFLSARAMMKHFMTGKVSGIDIDGNVFSFGDNQARYPLDNPAIATVNRNILIPTIAKLNSFFGFRRATRSRFVSLKTLYKLYKGKCQYCLEDISLKEASKDHYFPKSKGGTDDDFNLVLACRKCNQIKDASFPFYNKNGEAVRPKKINDMHFILDPSVKSREEWNPYLYRD